MALSLLERLRAKRAANPPPAIPRPVTIIHRPPPEPLSPERWQPLDEARRALRPPRQWPPPYRRASARVMKAAGWQMDYRVDQQGRLR